MTEMVETLHPQGKNGARVNRSQYEVYRRAILEVVPKDQRGVAFKELPDLVRPKIPKELLTGGDRCGWWVTTVKLDLEARGLVERVPGAKPQRLRQGANG